MPVIAGSFIGNQPPPRYQLVSPTSEVCTLRTHPSIHPPNPSNYSMPLFLDAVADLLLMTCCAGVDTAPVTCLFFPSFLLPFSSFVPLHFARRGGGGRVFFLFCFPLVFVVLSVDSLSSKTLALSQTNRPILYIIGKNNNYMYTLLDRLHACLLT